MLARIFSLMVYIAVHRPLQICGAFNKRSFFGRLCAENVCNYCVHDVISEFGAMLTELYAID